VKTKHKNKNKCLFFYLALPVFLVVFFIICKSAFATSSTIVVNEIQISGGSGKTTQEFIELYNTTDKDIDLTGFKLKKRTKDNPEETYLVSATGFKSQIIPKNGYFLISTSEYKNTFDANIAYSGANYSITDNNTIFLYNSVGNLVDKVGYGMASDYETFPARSPSEGKSIERKNFQDTDNNQDDFNFSDTPTPQNSSTGDDEEDTTPICKDNIILSEVFPFAEEYIKFYNKGEEKCNLKGWSVTDSIGYDPDSEELKEKDWSYHRNQFSEDQIIDPSGYAYFRGNLYLNDTDDTVKLFNSQKEKVQSVSYGNAESHKDFAYIFKDNKWDWDEDNNEISKNSFEAELNIDEDVFVNVYAYFEISGISKDTKVTWIFGDGHKSYLQKTKHKYEEVGEYDASVKYKNNGEYVAKNFTIDVGEVPHPKVKIVSVNANPKGSDTENETITLQNDSKKKVNLNGWSIATGWKKLINHPISVDFEIKAGKEKEITREISKFTLNNTKDKIELRYPDGEVAYKLKYKKENKGITEGELYVKAKGGWNWQNKNVESIKYNVSSINTENTVINNQENTNSEQENTENSAEDIQSEDIVVQPKIIRENKLALNDKNIFKIDLSNNSPRVLGAETVREVDGIYFFTPEYPQKEHFVITFLKNIFMIVNMKINLVIFFFKERNL